MDYAQRLEADRAVTQYGSRSYSAAAARTQPSSTAVSKAQPYNLTAPSAEATSHPQGSTAFQRAWADATHAAAKLDDYVDSLRAADRDPRYTSENIREHIAAFADTPAAQAVERSLELVRVTAEAAQGVAQRARANLEYEGDTADELRNTRFWDRTRRTLDATKEGKYLNVVRPLFENATPSELSTLLQELPAYLQSRGADAGFIDDLAAAAAPSYGRARQQAAVAQQALIITELNAKRLWKRFEAAYPTPDGFPRAQPVPMAPPSREYDPELA